MPSKPGQGAREPRVRRTSIKDVAAEAGVSLTTVSHVLNGKGRVDAATRERVLAVADQLSYLPNRVARGLVSGRTFTLGLSLPQLEGVPLKELLSSEWYAKLVVLASQRALESDYAVTVLPAFDSPADLGRYPVDGVLVLDPMHADPRLDVLARADVPHVSVGRDNAHPEVPCVRPDTAGGARELFTHLVERGARRLLVLSGSTRWDFVAETVQIAKDVFAAAGGTVEHRAPGLDGPGRQETRSREGLYRAVREATTSALASPEPPDAIVGLFEGYGASIVIAANSLGREVPGDVRVAQDIEDASTSTASPSITALDQHIDLQAAAGIDLLLARITEDGDVENVTTPVGLLVRGST